MAWPSMQENLSLGFVNNKVADQPLRPRRLMSAFVIHFFGKCHSLILIIYLVSVSEETGLSLALSKAPKIGFDRHTYFKMTSYHMNDVFTIK